MKLTRIIALNQENRDQEVTCPFCSVSIKLQLHLPHGVLDAGHCEHYDGWGTSQNEAIISFSGDARLLDSLLQFFNFDHLPEHLQAISKPFHELAHQIVISLPRNSERAAALRKLLEAKDCAVRAYLFKS